MNLFTLKHLILFSCILLLLNACKVDETPEITSYPIVSDFTFGGVTYKKVTGNIEKDFAFTSDQQWIISGPIFVKEGFTLSIQAGTNIYAAADGTTPFISIEQGAKIDAQGSADAPIVFSSQRAIADNGRPGDWGGIIINGKAPINSGEFALGEGETGKYGGLEPEDNSGTLRYVRIEYGGKVLGSGNELNGLSLNGVGSSTNIEYLQSFRCADDGIEIFGGTVNLKYILSTGNEDDAFDWTDGWAGKGQFWVAEQGISEGDRAIEADNNADDNQATPYSNPTIANATLIGWTDLDGNNQGIKLREGTKGHLYNFIITNFPKRGVQVEHDQTIDNLEDGSLSLSNSIVANNAPFVYTNSNNTPVTPTNLWEDLPTNSINPISLDGYIGVDESANATDPTNLDGWFSSAPYIGAVKSGGDWTSGWSRKLNE